MASTPTSPMRLVVPLTQEQARDLDDLHRQRRADVGAVDTTSAPSQSEREQLAHSLLVGAIEAELE